MAVIAITSTDTILQQEISSVFTPVAGIRNVEFTAPEVESVEVDDLESDFVDLLVTGRLSGGGVNSSMFLDPAAATQTALIAIINTPAMAAWKILWPDTGTTTQALDGILKKIVRKAERGEPLMQDIEIVTARKPTLV